MPQVADTGFLVAYWNKKDVHHRWARGLSVTAPLRTCEAVLTEAAYLLGTPEPRKRTPPTCSAGWRFADLDPGFADACVVKLGELHPRAEILTTDRGDFSAYRTLAGKPLRCVFPPV